jgi:IS605 OrfB family transposase
MKSSVMDTCTSVEKMVDKIISEKLDEIRINREWNEKKDFRDAQYNSFCEKLREKAKEIGFKVTFYAYSRGAYDSNGVMIKPRSYDFDPLTDS